MDIFFEPGILWAISCNIFFLIFNQPQGIISFREMAQEVNVLAAKFEDLSSIPMTPKVKVENHFPSELRTSVAHACVHAHINGK